MRYILPILLILGACGNYNPHEYIGADYLGAHYVRNPLGEGIAPDSDLQIRFDAFDCTTFVETALADGDVKKLNKIRYANGIPNILSRNHFVETDWIKNNSDIVRDVTENYGKTRTRTVTINKKKWFKLKYNLNVNVAPQTVKLQYIPYDNMPEINVDKPMIVLFIADTGKIRDKIGTDLAVRHMGFILPNGMLRHASYRHGQVMDIDFSKYVTQIMENKNNLGIMLLEIIK